jgi:hypothetical protein
MRSMTSGRLKWLTKLDQTRTRPCQARNRLRKTKRKQPFVQFRAMGAQVYEEEDGEVAL